jgi:hypothetical protein
MNEYRIIRHADPRHIDIEELRKGQWVVVKCYTDAPLTDEEVERLVKQEQTS